MSKLLKLLSDSILTYLFNTTGWRFWKSSFGGLGAFIILFSFFYSCKKSDKYPVEPVIKFKELIKFSDAAGLDTSAKLTISFTDGDGDIGLGQGDTFPPYNSASEFYFNFFMKYFHKENGAFVELPLAIPPNQRIPFVPVEGNNKSISGDIILDLEFAGLFASQDTFRFDAYIVDRALHKSNTITTSEIILTTQ